MNVKTIAAATLLSFISYASSAQVTPAKPATSLPAENVRIREGVKSGEITPVERARLKAQERNIRQERRAYRSDGTVTPAERADLKKDKRRLSRSVYRQKHDAQTTP